MKKTIISAIIIILILIAFFYRTQKPKISIDLRERKEIYNFDLNVCPGKEVEIKMQDPYMRGIIDEETPVKVSMNYYKCNALQTNDVVLYRFSEKNDPVIRRVVGKPGDQFSLKYVKDLGWTLSVNQKEVRGVNGPYYFGAPTPPPLALAQEARHGILRPGEAIVLSSFGPGDRDSGMFGVISVGDLVGKVNIENKGEVSR